MPSARAQDRKRDASDRVPQELTEGLLLHWCHSMESDNGIDAIEGCRMHGLSQAFPAIAVITDKYAMTVNAKNLNSSNYFLSFVPSDLAAFNKQQMECFLCTLTNDDITISTGYQRLTGLRERRPITDSITDDNTVASTIKPLVRCESDDGSCSDIGDSTCHGCSINNKRRTTIMPTASQAVKIMESAFQWFETQDISSVKLMQLKNFISYTKRAG